MKQLAKEQWEKDERRRKQIKEMGKLVEMHRRYNVENEETRSAVKKSFPAKKPRKSRNTQKAAGTFSDTGRRQAVAREWCWKGKGTTDVFGESKRAAQHPGRPRRLFSKIIHPQRSPNVLNRQKRA